MAAVSPHRGRRVLSGAVPYSPFGHFRGPLWRFCEAVFTLDPSKSRIPGRGRSDATNAPQIGELQVTGFRRGGDLVVLIEVGVRRPARTLCPPPQAGFGEFLLKPSLFVMRRSEDRPEFDWPCRT